MLPMTGEVGDREDEFVLSSLMLGLAEEWDASKAEAEEDPPAEYAEVRRRLYCGSWADCCCCCRGRDVGGMVAVVVVVVVLVVVVDAAGSAIPPEGKLSTVEGDSPSLSLEDEISA